MPWQQIGAITQQVREWQRLPVVLTEGQELFRARQSWTDQGIGAYPGNFYTQIRSIYQALGVGGYERVYPSAAESVVLLTIPPRLWELGFIERELDLRINVFGRPNASANFNLALDMWVEDGSAPQLIDGGTYD